jgi:hypothetical protein
VKIAIDPRPHGRDVASPVVIQGRHDPLDDGQVGRRWIGLVHGGKLRSSRGHQKVTGASGQRRFSIWLAGDSVVSDGTAGILWPAIRRKFANSS